MRAAVVAVCLIGSAGLWVWAWAPWESDSGPVVPAEYCGEFALHRFVPAQASDVPVPFRGGQQVFFRFREDGSYLYRARVSADYELVRNEGSLAMGPDGRLELQPLSENRAPLTAPKQTYRPIWIDDAEAGRLLSLTAIPEGYELVLRPLE